MTQSGKITDRAIILFVSFFGIGYLGKFSQYISSFIPFLFLLLSDELRIVLAVCYSLFTFTILFILMLNKKTSSIIKVQNEAMSYSSGMALLLSSPYIYFDINWIIAVYIVYNILLNIKSNKLEHRCSSNPELYKIARVLTTSLAAFITLHIFYIGHLIYPLIIMYFRK